MKNKKKLLIIPAALIAIIGATGSSCDTKESAPEVDCSKNCVNGTHTQVIRMPDGFRNIAFTCYGTVGLYVTSRGWVSGSADKNITPLPSDVTALPNDPHCV